MKNYILFLCALLTIGFASSCKQPTDFDTDRWSDKDTTAKPAQTELAGEWFLDSYEQSNAPMQYIPNGQTYSLNFKDSKNVNGKANCNTFTGTYQADRLVSMTAKVSFKNVSSTKMNCGTADLGDKYLSMLGASMKLTVQYYSSGQRLEISYFDAATGYMSSMFFKRQQTPDYDFDLLKGTEWTLVSFEKFGQPSEWIPLAFQQNLNINFLGDSMATGMAECGKFSAVYSTYNKPIPGTVDYMLGMDILNSVPCNGNYGSRFLEALKASKSYFRMGDSLEINYAINQGGTASRMMFVRKTNTPAVNPLVGTQWKLVSFETFGAVPVSVPSDQYIGVNFEDSILVGKADCQDFDAYYFTDNTTVGNTPDHPLSVKLLGSSAIQCGPASMGERFRQAIAQSKQYYIYQNTLEITYYNSSINGLSRMNFTRR